MSQRRVRHSPRMTGVAVACIGGALVVLYMESLGCMVSPKRPIGGAAASAMATTHVIITRCAVHGMSRVNRGYRSIYIAWLRMINDWCQAAM